MQRTRAVRTAVDGVLVLDKPIGLSSNAAMMQVRRLLDARKAGHGGTLDPLATGVLPILFGESTKFAADLLEADKIYEATLALGVATTTGDAEGEVTARCEIAGGDAGLSMDAVRAACAAFVGDIEQVPPMHSALKRDGRPLYAYAREGIEIERKARQVRIYAIDVLTVEQSPPTACATIRVHCSKGTYIRTLAEDIGKRLGCGAHLVALRRTGVGKLSIAQAVSVGLLETMSLEQRRRCLLAPDALLESLPSVDLPREDARRFMHGQRIVLATPHGWLQQAASAVRVRVYEGPRLLGTANLDASALLVPLRLIAQPTKQASPVQTEVTLGD